MEEQPLVSVVIASYNTAQYLPAATRSVLDQTWQNLEVIVIDDGSTDGTEEEMEVFREDARFRYIKTENRGQPKAKNRGIKEARGDYIAFCDADDLWRNDKLEKQIPAFSSPEVGVVYSEVSYLDEHDLPLNKPQPYERHSGNVTHELIIKNFVPFGTAVIRRICTEQHGIFDENLPMGIDWDLWLRYSINWKFHYVPEKTYIYRVWSGQMSSNYRGRYENAFLILGKFLKANQDTLPPKLVSRAWADMYISRSMSVARAEKTLAEPLADLIRGLRYDPTYWSAWKSLAKLFLRRV